MRILLVEDDDSVAQALEKVLASEHYAVDKARDGDMGWQLVEAFDYDLILLDVVLPKLDGIQFCQRLRAHDYQMPVLLLTAQDSTAQRVTGLDAGADDYVVKPFEFEELLARIRVLLRRANSCVITVLEWEHLRLTPSTHEVTYRNQLLNLTPKEYRLLELFLRKPQHVFSRSAILESLWSCDELPSEDTVTAHIKGLRHKLKHAGAPTSFIETVYGVGYRLKPIDSLEEAIAPSSDEPMHSTQRSAENNGRSSSQISSSPSHNLIQQQIKAALADVWQRSKGENDQRLEILKKVAIALRQGSVTPQLREQGTLAAHKLAGALGIFGLADGSRLARSIEHQLHAGWPLTSSEMVRLAQLIDALEYEIQENSRPQEHLMTSHWVLLLMVLIDDDQALAEQFVTLARAKGIQVQIASSIEDLEMLRNQAQADAYLQSLAVSEGSLIAVESCLPDVVLLNFAFGDTHANRLNLLSEIIQQTPPMPVLVCSSVDHLTNRVKASQLGAHAFLHEIDAHQLINIVTRVRSRLHNPFANILAVDDDPNVLATLRSLLEPWGINLTTLDQAPQFWQALENCLPDLLLLDVEMPEFNGIDLCRVIRHTPTWSELPVLFLTMHSDTDTEHRAFAAGANDLIDKALTPSKLLPRILSQLERSHLLRTMTAIADGKP